MEAPRASAGTGPSHTSLLSRHFVSARPVSASRAPSLCISVVVCTRVRSPTTERSREAHLLVARPAHFAGVVEKEHGGTAQDRRCRAVLPVTVCRPIRFIQKNRGYPADGGTHGPPPCTGITVGTAFSLGEPTVLACGPVPARTAGLVRLRRCSDRRVEVFLRRPRSRRYPTATASS